MRNYDICGRLATMKIFSFRENPCQSVDKTSPRFYTHDGNKNVSEAVAAVGTNTTVEVVAHYDYAAFGTVVAQKGDCAEANPWRFSSEYEDTELGLDYYNYRHYEPVMGRWLARDPIGEKGGFNLHGLARIVGKRPTALTERPTAFNAEGAEVGRHGECGKVLDRIDKIDRIVERGVSRLANPVNPVNPVRKTPCLLSSVSSRPLARPSGSPSAKGPSETPCVSSAHALSESNAPVAYSAQISFRENPCQSVAKTSPRLYAHDGNKNVSEAVAAASGTNATVEVVAHYAAFGAVVAQKGDCAEANPWRFSCEYEDTELGLDYYNYRHYEPVTGRWLSFDIIDELLLYLFCFNNPIVAVDIVGLQVSIQEDPGQITVSMKRGIRGKTVHQVSIQIECSSAGFMSISGSAYRKIVMLNDGNEKWKRRYRRYDRKWGTDRSDSDERNATYSHEMDHYRSYDALFAFIHTLNGLDGSYFGMCFCPKEKERLEAQLSALKDMAERMSRSYDLNGRNEGGVYPL